MRALQPERTARSVFFLVIFIILIALTIRLFYRFTSIFLWATLFYITLRPLHVKVLGAPPAPSAGRRTQVLFNIKRNFFAGLFAFSALLLVGVPLYFLGGVLAKQFMTLATTTSEFLIKNPRFLSEAVINDKFRSINLLGFIDLSQFNVGDYLLKIVNRFKVEAFGYLYQAVGGVSNFVVGLFFMMFALFFFFADGARLARLLINAVPIEESYSRAFITRFEEASKGLLFGFFLTALCQGTFAAILFLCFGVNGALALGAIVCVASFIPIFGGSLVWIPLGILQGLQYGLGRGLLFIALAALFISLPDNFLRPYLLRDRINIHPLLIFFSILGGITIHGVNGLIMGPLTLILFFTALDIFKKNNT